MREYLEVRYKCVCMETEVAVRLPFRAADRDVVDWMREDVGAAISADHRARSPTCARRTMAYVKIPNPESAPHIGGRPEVH